MSLILTESFGIFKRFTGTDTQAVVAAQQLQFRDMFARAGYTFTYVSGIAGWVVRDDPLNPAGAALVFTPHPTQSAATLANFSFSLPAQPDPLIIGFSLYIPPEYVPLTVPGVMLFTVYCKGSSLVLFSIRQDLTIARSTGTADQQSPRKLVVGRLNYVELRMTPTMYQVWVDDALMYEMQLLTPKDNLSITMQRAAGAPEGLRWAIGNMYVLSQDNIAPNQRLGPTTRLISSAPDSDVSVEFVRPLVSPTNASVVAQPLDETQPTLTLQAEGVGARDEYAFASNPAIAGAALVHAVSTKVVAANLESAAHALRPFVSDGDVDGADQNYFVADMVTVTDARALTGACVREDGTMFICGTGPSVWYSTDGGESWAKGYDGGTAVIAQDIACGPDGTVIACCNGGQLLTCLGTDGPETWTFAMSPANGFNLMSIAVSPAGTWVCSHLGGNASQLVKFGAATWQLQNRANASWVGFVGGAFYGNTSALAMIRSVDAVAWAAVTPAPPNGVGSKFPVIVKDGVLSRYYFRAAETVTVGRYTGTSWVTEQLSTQAGLSATTQNIEGAVRNPTTGVSLVVALGLLCMIPADQTLAGVTVRGPTVNAVSEQSNVYGSPCPWGEGFLIPINMASGGNSGKAILIRRRRSVRPITMNNGYILIANSASVDPSTGLPWTAAAADAATGGMTVIS